MTATAVAEVPAVATARPPLLGGRLGAALIVLTACLLPVFAMAVLDVAGPRWATLVVAGAAGVLASLARDTAARIAILLLPVTASIRRITGGEDAYVLNDPLVLLPLVVMIPSVLALPGRVRSPATNWLLLLAGWLVVSGGLGTISLGQPALYGLITGIVPLAVGIQLSQGRYPGLAPFILKAHPTIGFLLVGYGILQYFAPPSYDLTWLTTRAAYLTSVGDPIQGEFRLFGTSENPTSFAAYLGLVLLIVITSLVLRPSAPTLRLLLVVGSLVVLSWTGVRTTLFALPLVILIALAIDRRVSKPVLIGLLPVVTAASLVLPSLLASSDQAAARYDVGGLSQDSSFQARAEILTGFVDAFPGRPFGSGPGTTGLTERLTKVGEGAAVIDNGYLARMLETGAIGLVLFVVTIVVCLRAPVRRLRSGVGRPTDLSLMAIAVYFLLIETSLPTTSSTFALFFWVALGSMNAPDPPAVDAPDPGGGRPAATAVYAGSRP